MNYSNGFRPKSVKYLSIASLLAISSALAVDLAKVNGKVVTDRDVQNALGGFNEGQRKKILSDMNSKNEIVSNIVEQELLVQEGEKQKLDQEQDYKEAFNQFRRQYLTEKVLKKNVAPKITESMAKNYFKGNARRYSTDRVKVQHILLNDEKDANDVLRLVKSGQDFQAVAESRSKDPSAKNNRGDVGFVTWESPFVDEFKETAFKLKKDEVSAPVKTLYGYHIIKVIEVVPGKHLEYAEVELRVKSDLKKELIRNFINDLRNQAKIEIDSKAVGKL